MSYRYCTKCESVFEYEDENLGCCYKSNLIDWEEFAFIMGYPLHPNKKKYDVFHLDLYKRKDSQFRESIRISSPENFYREFNHWKETELRKRK
ncbi:MULTISPECIES: aldehyde dehydrogenase [Bacillus cereus group]|uniref:aldehyde dehydrogenase n=1 Tax=Bacillus cereus group TaxID=86661 RepID=UPI001E4570E6|nr:MULTISPECIES: aldehyde dehydrogenase [Bacillus cereus group]MCC2414349.1 aldehyde dehydrogenase [Bacillus paranthracis]MDK7547371.1 aldehyde dehydrogenase [Bacillus pacificus]MDK7552754.1 aldehyde dehydrogenase [Bacillus pacificus]MDK7569087.1 aldehyde dehydrogenase [Bacillus pacificus]MDK7582062.1 aldehyde dehydrogenase [Bacillus pacificus]